AELHERFATWTEDQRSEYDEIVGYHLEQAYHYREQLGVIDDALAQRAASRLAAAGRRADGRGDAHAAASLLGRAVALMPQADRERLELLLLQGQPLFNLGEIAEAERKLEEGIAGAQAIAE